MSTDNVGSSTPRNREAALKQHTLARIVSLPILSLALSLACGREESVTSPDQTLEEESLQVIWLGPADGSGIVDTIRVSASLTGPTPRGLTLHADRVPVGSTNRPPWSFRWLPTDTVSGSYCLQVAVHLDGHDSLMTRPVKVNWSPNAPPRVRLLGTNRFAMNRSIGESLRVAATDPDDGRLTGDRIVWGSDRQGLIGFGEQVPVSALTTGRHHLTVRAADRWQRNGFLRFEIELFDYTGAATPLGLIEDLRHALSALDGDTYTELLAPEFRFLFCLTDRATDPSVPIQWHRDEEIAFARTLLDTAVTSRLTVDWRIGSIQTIRLYGQQRFKVEIESIDIEVARDTGIDFFAIRGAKARLLLGRSNEGDAWRLEQWQDLGNETGISQGLLRVLMTKGL